VGSREPAVVGRGAEVGVDLSSGEFDQGVALLDELRGMHAEMRAIKARHEWGEASADDRRRYLTCWFSLALRRSPGRRPYLPPEFDAVLAERHRLLADIEDERTRQAVEAAFGSAPEGEAPPQGVGSPAPR
jgi:hypothetical protein